MEESQVSGGAQITDEAVDLDHIRRDLQENYDRHAFTLDKNRQESVAKRHARGGRMPRENIAELMDENSFKNIGPWSWRGSTNATTWNHCVSVRLETA